MVNPSPRALAYMKQKDDPIDNQRSKWRGLEGGRAVSPGMSPDYRCPYCNKRRPLLGRRKVSVPGTTKTHGYKCAECQKTEEAA